MVIPHKSPILSLRLVMKLQSIDLPIGKKSPLTKIVILLTLTLTIVLATLYNSFLGSPLFPPSSLGHQDDISVVPKPKEEEEDDDDCDMFSGEWVPNPEAPYYTNSSCWAIHAHQNCMKYGRPDTDYLKWRWKPYGCDLPLFDPAEFLELLRDKSMAFVGDSVGRNQMQSMICLLSRVEFPEDISFVPDDYFRRWNYTTYNFTLVTYWTPHLVRTDEADPNGPSHTGLFNLYLDEPDQRWSRHIAGLDYIILNAGHWFYRPMMYYENNRLVGCHACSQLNTTDLQKFYGYRKAFQTAFRAINAADNKFEGTLILRTFAPSHFENGLWNEGGNCVRERPLFTNETVMEGIDLEFHTIQLEEFKVAEAEGKDRGLRYRLLDTTQAMLMRPDGHPGKYGHWPNENVTLYNDCVHWCLPGPIDTMSDFLLKMLKMEGRRSERKT